MDPNTPESQILADVPTPSESISWRAPEFEFNEKKVGWYLLLVLVFAALVGVAVLTKQWLSIGVLAAMTAAVAVYAGRKPRELDYIIDETGITIERKHYGFDQFQSFALIHHDNWEEVDLDPVKRFMPRITISLDEQKDEAILATLSNHLPEIDREPDLVERITRRLKF